MARERRATRRLPVLRSRLRCPTLAVKALDISAQGLAVESTQALRVGGRYRFSLHFEGDESSFEGRVLWCRLSRIEALGGGDARPIFRAGVRRLGESR